MSLKKNVFALAMAQLFNYILPFLQFPYLTRVLGNELFGLIMFGLSVITMLQVITDYGLEIYLTKKITENESHHRMVENYLYETLIVKFILMIVCTFIFILIYKYTILYGHFELSMYFCMSIMFNSFNPMWLFQSLEKLYIYARVIIFSKITLLMLVFIFIKQNGDYVFFGLINLICVIIVNAILYLFIFFKFKFMPKKTNFCTSIKLLKYGFEYFASRASASIYIIGCSIFLGAFSVVEQVSLYGVAEKLYIAGCGVFAPLINAIIPYMNRSKNFNLFYKITGTVFIVSLLGSLTGYIFGEDILVGIFGESFINAKPILDILLLALVFNIMGMMFGYPALMPIGKVKHANLSVIYSGLIQVVLFSALLLYDFPLTGINVAITFLISTLCTFLYRIIIFIFHKK